MLDAAVRGKHDAVLRSEGALRGPRLYGNLTVAAPRTGELLLQSYYVLFHELVVSCGVLEGVRLCQARWMQPLRSWHCLIGNRYAHAIFALIQLCNNNTHLK